MGRLSTKVSKIRTLANAGTGVLAAIAGIAAAMIAVGMNGQPLPGVHGFPARIVTPGLYGFVSATT